MYFGLGAKTSHIAIPRFAQAAVTSGLISTESAFGGRKKVCWKCAGRCLKVCRKYVGSVWEVRWRCVGSVGGSCVGNSRRVQNYAGAPVKHLAKLDKGTMPIFETPTVGFEPTTTRLRALCSAD